MSRESSHVLKVIDFPVAYDFQYTPYRQISLNEFSYHKCLKDRSSISAAKVIIIGDLSVGKSSLITRFCHQFFQTNYRFTIGVDVHSKRCEIFNSCFDLQIWDTAGQERFRSIALSYYRGAKAIVILFDLGNLETLNSASRWLNEALSVQGSNCPLVFLVGSKMDLLRSESAFQRVETIAKAKSLLINAEYWSVSSKTGKNVENLFRRISALVFHEMMIAYQTTPIRNVDIGKSMIELKDGINNKNKQYKCHIFTCVK